MGGRGSGRIGWHHRVEQYPQMSIRSLAAMLKLPAAAAGIEWQDFEISARLDLRTDGADRRITITILQPEAGVLGGTFQVTRRPMRFGGERNFFRCPFCW